MSRRPILAAIAIFMLAAGCSSSGDGATVTAAGSVASSPTAEALADSTTTTAVPPLASTTTTAPATTTTVPAPTTTTRKPAQSTTTTTFPAGTVRLTIVNEHPRRVDVGVNGTSYSLAAGQRLGPVPVVPAADLNDVYSAVVHGTQCGLGDAGPLFQKGPGSSVTMRLKPQGNCDPAGPGVPNLGVAFEGI